MDARAPVDEAPPPPPPPPPTVAFSGFAEPIALAAAPARFHQHSLVGSRYYATGTLGLDPDYAVGVASMYDLTTGMWTELDRFDLGDTHFVSASSAIVDFDGALYVLYSDFFQGAFEFYWYLRRSADNGVSWETVAQSPGQAGAADLAAIGPALYVIDNAFDFAFQGGRIFRSDNGVDFALVHGPISFGFQDPQRHGDAITVVGWMGDGSSSRWTEQASIDDGLTWTQSNEWFATTSSQFNRAVHTFEVPDVAGYFVGGIIEESATSRVVRVIHVGTQPEPIIVDTVPLGDEGRFAEFETLVHPSGQLLHLVVNVDGTSFTSTLRATRDGENWETLLATRSQTQLRLISALPNGDLVGIYDTVATGESSLVRVPAVYE